MCTVVGGGAAGFFLAINLKEMCPAMDVTIVERGQRVLRKVEVSGGGRCNCTNTFDHVSDLQQVYPRGHRLLKRLFRQFGPRDAYQWFERHGVQPDHAGRRLRLPCLAGLPHHHQLFPLKPAVTILTSVRARTRRQ